jgi:hypothetical protein
MLEIVVVLKIFMIFNLFYKNIGVYDDLDRDRNENYRL